MIVIDSNMFDYYFDPTTKEHRYVKIDKLSELWQKPIGGRDATIIAMMQYKGVYRIFTHDGGFKELEFLEVIDPIPENKQIKRI